MQAHPTVVLNGPFCTLAECVLSQQIHGTLFSPDPNQYRSPSQWWGFMVAAFSDGHLIPPLPKETHIIQFAAKKRIKMLIRLRPNNPLK